MRIRQLVTFFLPPSLPPPSLPHSLFKTQYTGFFDVVQKMYKTEGGVNAFMSGSSARVLWLLPFTVIHLGVYEST